MIIKIKLPEQCINVHTGGRAYLFYRLIITCTGEYDEARRIRCVRNGRERDGGGWGSRAGVGADTAAFCILGALSHKVLNAAKRGGSEK